MSFICYQSIFVTVVHAYFNGMMIEGGARWGYDPMWESDDIPFQPGNENVAVCETKNEKRRSILQAYLQSQVRRENYWEHKKSILSLETEEVQTDTEQAHPTSSMKYDFSEPPQPTHYLG